jgi:uncharacterized protein YodC (DUF2158 family)
MSTKRGTTTKAVEKTRTAQIHANGAEPAALARVEASIASIATPKPIMAIGDPVRLRSGGARMTVVKVSDDPVGGQQVTCTWHSSTGQPHSIVYPRDAVEHVPDKVPA